MAALALALFVLYAALAFGLRMVLQFRRSGSTGFKGVSGRSGSLEWTGGVLFAAALALLLGAPALQLAGLIDPIAFLDGRLWHVAGLVLFGIGLAATMLSQAAMGASWRIGVDEAEETTLVTGGPFAVVRNPIFSAMFASSLGLALLAPNALALAGFAALVAAVELQVRFVEEPYLIRAHGDRYLEYASRVGRFAPGLGAESVTGLSLARRETLHRRGVRLEVFTIAWNVVEAVVAIGAGLISGSVALVGFGVDSAVEVISAVALLWRLLKAGPNATAAEAGSAEKRALYLVAATFFLLAAYIAYEAIGALLSREGPDGSTVGLVLSVLSLLIMPALAFFKQRTGREMGSEALRADAVETWVCSYLSLALLAGVGLYAAFGWWWADPVGALAMLPVILWQGWETLGEAREKGEEG